MKPSSIKHTLFNFAWFDTIFSLCSKITHHERDIIKNHTKPKPLVPPVRHLSAIAKSKARATADSSSRATAGSVLRADCWDAKCIEGCNHKRNSPAFTLIEVILAIGVLTTTIFVISNLMTRSFMRVESCRDDIEKIFIIKRELYANYFKPPQEGKRVVQKIEEPPVTITSWIDEIKDKSSLKKFKSDLRIVRSEAAWKGKHITRDSSMMSLVFQPKKEEPTQ